MRSIKEQLFTAVEQANLTEIQRIFDNNPVTIQDFFKVHQDYNLMGYADSWAVDGDTQRQRISAWLEQKFKQFIPHQEHSASAWLNGIYYPINSNAKWKQQLTHFLDFTPEAELIEALPLHLHIASNQKNWEIVLRIYAWFSIDIIWLDNEKAKTLLQNPVIKRHLKKLTNTLVQSRARDNSPKDNLLSQCLKEYMEFASPSFTPCLYDDILIIAKKNKDYEVVSLVLKFMKEKNPNKPIPIAIAEDDWNIVLLICQLSERGSLDFDNTLKKAIECLQQDKADRTLLLSCIKQLHAYPIRACTEKLPDSAGNTSLHFACLNADRELILALLNIYMSCHKNNAGKIPLEIVADNGDFETLRKMCAHIDNQYGDEKFRVRGIALFKAVQALKPDSENGVLLELIDDLLKHDFDISPATIATANENGFTELAKKLFQKGTNLDQQPGISPNPNQFFIPPKQLRTPAVIPSIPPSVKPVNHQNWEAKKSHLKKFIADYNAAHSWLNPGPKESQDLVAQLKQVVDTVKDKKTAFAKIEKSLRTFFHTRFVIGNFADTQTITQLKNCKIIKEKAITDLQKIYGALLNLFIAFDSQTSSSAYSDKLIDDLKYIHANLNKIPLKEQYKKIRKRCDEYLIQRIESGNTKKTDTVLLLQQYIGITDADIQAIQEQLNNKYDYEKVSDLPGAEDFFDMVPKNPK